MALVPGKHRSKEIRLALIETVRKAKERTGCPVRKILKELEVSHSSYYRYVRSPQPNPRKPRSSGPPLTPLERHWVKETALSHPSSGYKSLTWILQNELLAGVRAHQVYQVLHEENLIVRRVAEQPLELRRPAEPTHANEVWHIDLMYVWVNSCWTYLVDILDGYSRYVVHWTLNETMEADTVTLTVLEALERLKLAKQPLIVHDHGSQFISNEWRKFCSHHGLTSIPTRVAHPQSNGKVERLHRTHREEGLVGYAPMKLDEAREEIDRWVEVYNNLRPHSSLMGLPPIVYYQGEPESALAQREHFVLESARERTNYWRLRELAGVS
ncbi:MAG: IS3 family transposase [Methanothrix sp.]|nr:IS3 family transposase [Methanothrix sp.]